MNLEARHVKVKFYLTISDRSPIEEFLSDLSQDLKSDFLDAVVLLEQGQILSLPLSRNLSSIYKGLHELRLKDRTGACRFFYFIKKADGIILCMLLKRKLRSFREKKSKLY